MNTCLLTSPALGALFLIGLFCLCFFLVHFVRLADMGWKSRKTEEKPAPPPTKPAPPPEPVYYIVEKKRKPKRTKTEYSEPKEFRFK